MTKPTGSLGRLEELVADLAAWQGDPMPSARPAAAVLFAADHPVVRHGVSAYPQAVTRAMVANLAAGGAGASVMAAALGLPLLVVDVGVDGPPQPGSKRDPVASRPEGDVRTQDAMTPADYALAVGAGVRAADACGPVRVLVPGEVGIGNTTLASSVCAALFGGDPDAWVGPGTGVSGDALERKREVVRDVVERLGGERRPHQVLRRAGGRELAALAGAMGRAAERRTTVLVDGFIATTGAAVLLLEQPEIRPALVFAHRSAEGPHAKLLGELGVEPLLDLGMRLGEGTGALAAFPVVELACEMHARMATFESASVPDR